MSSRIRELLRATLPNRLRSRIRYLLEPPPIETVVLRDYRFMPEAEERPRLSLVIPSLSRAEAFGGVLTAVDLLDALGAALAARGVRADLRAVCEEPHNPRDSVVSGPRAPAVHALRPAGWTLPTRRREIFIAFNFWIRINLEPVLAQQAQTFPGANWPLLYLFQEYEPGFFPFSPAHMIAREAAEDGPMPLWIIINSQELAAYWRQLGHRASRVFILEPRMSPKLRAFLAGLGPADKDRILLLYGRPGFKRNCFTILIEGLRRWAADTRAAGDWRIVSAGVRHRTVPLAGGRRIESVGKLGLEAYGALLRQSAVGVALMASPHPSYPPLEMAHFGIRTITNRFPPKDPAARHANLLPLPRMRGADLARLLEETMLAFEADPGIGLAAPSFMPDYLSDRPSDCVADLADGIHELLSGRQGLPTGAAAAAAG